MTAAAAPLAVAEQVALHVLFVAPGIQPEQSWAIGFSTATLCWVFGPQLSHTVAVTEITWRQKGAHAAGSCSKVGSGRGKGRPEDDALYLLPPPKYQSDYSAPINRLS